MLSLPPLVRSRPAGGAAAMQTWRRCFYRECAVRAALAAMVDFELGK